MRIYLKFSERPTPVAFALVMDALVAAFPLAFPEDPTNNLEFNLFTPEEEAKAP